MSHWFFVLRHEVDHCEKLVILTIAVFELCVTGTVYDTLTYFVLADLKIGHCSKCAVV